MKYESKYERTVVPHGVSYISLSESEIIKTMKTVKQLQVVSYSESTNRIILLFSEIFKIQHLLEIFCTCKNVQYLLHYGNIYTKIGSLLYTLLPFIV